MERYKAMWIPSPDDFVEKQQLVGRVNGAAEAVLADGLPSSAMSALLDLPTDAGVELWVRTFGDNGTKADSQSVSFVATNGSGVRAASGLTVVFVEHLA